MRRFRVALISALVILWAVPLSAVLADTSQEVVVTAQGYVEQPIIATCEALDVTWKLATLKGSIIFMGSGDIDYRGFVWGTSSQDDPGNVSPEAMGYGKHWIEEGDFGVGTYGIYLDGLEENTSYYHRAVVHTSFGWVYGEEKNLTTNQEPSLAILRITPTIVALFIILLCVKMGGMSLTNWIMSFVGAMLCYLIATAIIGTL